MKAFDTVDHTILSEKFRTTDIRGLPHEWYIAEHKRNEVWYISKISRVYNFFKSYLQYGLLFWGDTYEAMYD